MVDKILPTEDRYGSKLNHFEDDDFIDRLNNRWTVHALIICIFVVGGNMLWLKHITCWTPSMMQIKEISKIYFYCRRIC